MADAVRRLLPLVSALMLLLVLWTGSAAHAAEALDCGEAMAGAAEHYDGDRDEVPADSGKATPHHHNACHGHCMAVPTADQASLVSHREGGRLIDIRRNHLSGSGPDATLRPPIA